MVRYKKKPDMEIPFQPALYKQEEIEDLYELRKEREERPLFEEKPLPEERVVKEVLVARQAMPRMEDHKIQPLKLLGREVIGSLFDRLEFLRKRIEEIQDTLKVRESLHNDMVAEIEVDIKEKDAMATRVADINEKRNLKLDVSILRKEKRLESVQFWRDLVELHAELRELMENFETETKIVNIFRQIKPEQALTERAQEEE